MAKAKRAKKSKKSKGRKKPRTAAQKRATKALVARNRKCPPGKKHRAKKGAKKGKAKRKGARKARRSPAQKAATKRMLAANRKHSPKKGKARKVGKRKGRKGHRKGHKRAVGTGVEKRLSHVETKVNKLDKTVQKHGRALSTLGANERKMRKSLKMGAPKQLPSGL